MKRTLKIHILAFIMSRLVLDTGYRMVYPFLPAISRGLGVELGEMSLALTLRNLSGVIGPLMAQVSDRRGRKAGMILGLMFFCTGCGLVALFPSFHGFVAGLVLSSMGGLVFSPSMFAFLGDKVPYERRGQAIGLTELSWGLSFVIGMPLVGLLIAKRGWHAPFPILMGFGLLLLIGLSRLLHSESQDSSQSPGLLGNLEAIFTSPAVWMAFSVTTFFGAASELVNVIFGVWMEDSFGLKIAGLGLASLGIGMMELLGDGFVAGLTDRLGKLRSIALGLMINCLATLMFPLVRFSLPGAVAALLLFYLSFEFTIVSCLPLATELVPTARASMLATQFALSSLGRALGAGLATPLYTQAAVPGIAAIALMAVFFNLVALGALFRLRRLMNTQSTIPYPRPDLPV